MNITYHLVTNLGNLKLFAPNALEELSVLARNVKFKTSSVTNETLVAFFKHGGDLAIACDEGIVVAMASTVRVFKINANSARLEHVSVLPSHQKQGIAEKLISILVSSLNIAGDARYLDLTCEPSREGANRLYERMGFKLRATNPRRLELRNAAR